MNSSPGGGPGPEGRDPELSPLTGVHGSPSLVGTVLAGRYRILRQLGQGAMGSVYLGEHLKIGRKDAIKVLRGALAMDSESIARFERGARNLSAIRHPNVCTLYDYGETADGSPFLALEFVTGETLKDLIQREVVLAPDRAIHIAWQAAEALEAAHDAGIVHRDLKPANIMIEQGRGGADVVKVVDFDIAKGPEGEGEELTRLGFVVGTPEYMSPEQLAGERLDGRSDVYSLGLVLFRMLTGVLPFKGGTAQDVMIERLTNAPMTLEQARPGLAMPAGLQPVLDRALARNRNDRYARAEDLARDLAALRAGATLPPPSPRTAPPILQQPGATGTVAARHEFVPDTRVSASTPARDESGRATATPGGRRWLMYAVAATALLGGGAGVYLATLGGGGTDSTEGITPMGGPSNTSGIPQSGDSLERSSGGEGENNPRPETTAVNRGGGAGPGGGARPAAENPDTVLMRLLDRLDTNANPDAAATVSDTAIALYGRTELPSDVRALAAYIAASAMQITGDDAGCITWIRRALQLKPAYAAYENQLRACGGTQP
jgi:serine/threonine protein kinase